MRKKIGSVDEHIGAERSQLWVSFLPQLGIQIFLGSNIEEQKKKTKAKKQKNKKIKPNKQKNSQETTTKIHNKQQQQQ